MATARSSSGTRLEQRPPHSLRLHAQAEQIPEMTKEEYVSLLSGVAEGGITEPLEITAAGVVLDGRHRLSVAKELGLKAVPVRLAAPEDEVAHMLLAALQRRHLSQSQKAALAVELDCYQRARAEANERRRANLRGAEVATLPPRGQRTREYAARIAGVSGRTIQDALTVRELDPELFERIKAGKLPAHVARRQLERAGRDAGLDKAPPLPAGRYELIYADPPWQLGNPDSDYAPEAHYPTMPLEEIKALPVPVADDALLYLWAVNSQLLAALEVLAAWGFAYRSNEVWVKPSIGMGIWTRNRHELLLIGRRGTASPPQPQDRLDSVIEAQRGRHSEKPACVYERLEQLYPSLRKLELFARGRPRPGWDAWGNEVEAA